GGGLGYRAVQPRTPATPRGHGGESTPWRRVVSPPLADPDRLVQLSLPHHSYLLRSTPASKARRVNCYAEQLPPDADTPVLLTRTPGVTDWTTVGTGPIVEQLSALGL